MNGRGVPILMYHSVSPGAPGPVSIDPAVFRGQLDALADAGSHCVSVTDYVTARRAGRSLPPGTCVLTFDDGYLDFAEIAYPLVRARGWRATVFLIGDLIDAAVPWNCGDRCPRPLLTWPMVSDLAAQGVEFGAHSLTHRDLTRLGSEDARREIVESGERIRTRSGVVVEGFAPPYGRSTQALRAEIARHYQWSVGARAGRADGTADLFDLPRIEMWYFRNIARWRDYVARGWTPYFALRTAMRAVREAL